MKMKRISLKTTVNKHLNTQKSMQTNISKKEMKFLMYPPMSKVMMMTRKMMMRKMMMRMMMKKKLLLLKNPMEIKLLLLQTLNNLMMKMMMTKMTKKKVKMMKKMLRMIIDENILKEFLVLSMFSIK